MITGSSVAGGRTVAALAASLEHANVVGDGRETVSGITIDSREVQPGDLFAALPGSDFDGHAYIPQAVRAGATAVLAERVTDRLLPVTWIIVNDARAALANVSSVFYGYPDHELTMIGLTGTDGKTTTSFLVRDILRAAGIRTGLIGTVGIEIGDGTRQSLPHQTTPESHLIQRYLREMVSVGTSVAVMEATSHGLAMHRLDGTRFTIAGVTNVTREHLEFHKTVEAYLRAKAILVERVASVGGIVILNRDDAGARRLAEFASGADVRWYSQQEAADLRATDIDIRSDGCRFRLEVGGWSSPVRLPMLGAFNVSNALCAVGVAMAAGVRLETCVAALEQARGVPGRMTLVDEGQPFGVIVDYAHTPESIEKILRLVRDLHPTGRIIVVSGSAGERDPGKRPLQGDVMARLADVTVITSEDPRNEDPDAIIADIVAGAVEAGGVVGDSVRPVTDREEAIALAFSLANAGDCVLLAGKGHETSIIQGFAHVPWDEEAVARRLLRS